MFARNQHNTVKQLSSIKNRYFFLKFISFLVQETFILLHNIKFQKLVIYM